LHLGVAGWSVRTLPVILLMALGEVASVGWRGLSSHAFAPPSAANWAHIVGFLYGITWIWAAERVWFLRGGGLYATGRTTPEEEAPFAAVARWERALEADPHDHEALVRLPTALALAGDADRAVTCAANAVSEALRRGDAASAAERFVALQDLEPHRSMTDDLALDAATALAEGGSPELAVTVSDHVAQRTAADDLRARSEVRSALCLMRHLRCLREAAERLQTMLGRATDPEWRAYVTRLLREAESADPKA
jgi:hypothetical protein